ncbi:MULTISPECIES: chemotaxis protein CheW [Alteromonas]|jgi:purine-binding chemotaxis protein CheW|uniref:Chemotaxis protein CheW n=1 Tax=Alteromonas stellipolaris TaxID=233316 RepID=A0ABN4LM89_9ALTE|nr:MULTISPECIES: chemotaxis protein CheW [Alteromonas]AMJ89276.1 chemotaxis protein CheW [Alteromonas sp. Mac2]ALM92198.1 Positive regulator of CheA protein activity [Alteromonas stellipolaris LMG 21856]AMJ72997.1 chemotaxis protein CheW [Alteromonas stellipolaris]AMJ85389.1 chemotaxis protein CheW [Alteromonas sp. Mac1]AMJ93115.1 chemotaxis protein CheW [Alteromonas stellipolaris]
MSDTALHQAVIGGDDKEYLSFVLADEHYALDIKTVKEIRGYEQVTKIANAPAFIKGVINLRGDIVPIVDLRLKFNVGEATYTEFTIVIMLNIQDRIVGIVVDGVSDVIRLMEDQILAPPEFGVAFDSRYLHGLADVDGQMVILVNIESLITSEEMGLVAPESVNEDA